MKLIHGDCIEELKELPDGCVDLVIADPPYGTTRNRWDTPLDLDSLWPELWRVCRGGGSPVLLFSQQPFTSALGASQLRNLRYEWVWQKPQGTGFLNANRAPLKAHENVLVFYRKAPRYFPQKWDKGEPWHGTGTTPGMSRRSSNYGKFDPRIRGTDHGTTLRYPLDVVQFNNLGRNKWSIHPTQKPVDLLEYLIRTYTEPGDTVLDFCMGSGSTGVACARTGRDFIGIELDDHYFEVASERIESEAASTASVI